MEFFFLVLWDFCFWKNPWNFSFRDVTVEGNLGRDAIQIKLVFPFSCNIHNGSTLIDVSWSTQTFRGRRGRVSHQNKKLEYDLCLPTTIDLCTTLLKNCFSEFSDPSLIPPGPKMVSKLVGPRVNYDQKGQRKKCSGWDALRRGL